jgi:hypothetical protein
MRGLDVRFVRNSGDHEGQVFLLEKASAFVTLIYLVAAQAKIV